jgi:hypothetical protein
MQASPSKARAHALESHAWSVVTGWLSVLYSPSPIPPFERNATTLKALQSLMAENLAAEKLQMLLFEAKREELEGGALYGHANRRGGQSEAIMALLEDSLNLEGREAMDDLASAAVALGCPSTTSSSSDVVKALSVEMLGLPRQIFALEDHLNSVENLTADLETQTNHTKDADSALRREMIPLARTDGQDVLDARPITPQGLGSGPDFSQLHARTQQHQHETKQLQMKSIEYQNRIAALERQLSPHRAHPGSISMEELSARQKVLEGKREAVAELGAKFKAFHGLPPDLQTARREVQRAQAELDALKRKRDVWFEKM